MKRKLWIPAMLSASMFIGCSHRHPAAPALQAKASGAAIVESSGGKQLGAVGTQLPQPLVVQVNDQQGNAVSGAKVDFAGSEGVAFDPSQVLTDESGQATTNISLGGIAGRYQITASSTDAKGKVFSLTVTELAAGYQEEAGRELNDKYCSRCHDPDSTPQQVSNYDNLDVKPNPFTAGDIYNKLSGADLMSIIVHGGPSMNRSALMPPYGATLSKAELQALVAYIRLVSDPPYATPGVVYAKK